jgi:hypothetical protein
MKIYIQTNDSIWPVKLDMTLHYDKLTGLQANQHLAQNPQYLLFIISRETASINSIIFGFTLSGIKPTIYHTSPMFSGEYL